MVGLFFEDINYAADGGLYAEMIENRSFEFVDCYGTVGDYYTKPDPGYGWSATQEHGTGRMEYVSGSPLDRVNPHYLRFTADHAGQGFANKAYDGVTLKKGESYHAVFYAPLCPLPGRPARGCREGSPGDRRGRRRLRPCPGGDVAEVGAL